MLFILKQINATQAFEHRFIRSNKNNFIQSIRPSAPSKATTPYNRYSTSSFSYQYHMNCWSSINRYLRLLHRLPFIAIIPSVMCFTRRLLRKIRPIDLVFILPIVSIISLSSCVQCNNTSLLTWSYQMIFLKHQNSKCCG